MNDTRDVELNAIGVLKRREIEARLLAPVVEALGREFGRERVLQLVRETIVGIARDQGRQLVEISRELGDLPHLRVREARRSCGVETGRSLRELHVDGRGRGSAMFGHPSPHLHMMKGVAAAAKSRKTQKHLKPHLKNRLGGPSTIGPGDDELMQAAQRTPDFDADDSEGAVNPMEESLKQEAISGGLKRDVSKARVCATRQAAHEPADQANERNEPWCSAHGEKAQGCERVLR